MAGNPGRPYIKYPPSSRGHHLEERKKKKEKKKRRKKRKKKEAGDTARLYGLHRTMVSNKRVPYAAKRVWNKKWRQVQTSASLCGFVPSVLERVPAYAHVFSSFFLGGKSHCLLFSRNRLAPERGVLVYFFFLPTANKSCDRFSSFSRCTPYFSTRSFHIWWVVQIGT